MVQTQLSRNLGITVILPSLGSHKRSPGPIYCVLYISKSSSSLRKAPLFLDCIYLIYIIIVPCTSLSLLCNILHDYIHSVMFFFFYFFRVKLFISLEKTFRQRSRRSYLLLYIPVASRVPGT